MNNVYISIGAQCTTPRLFEELGIKTETLPFDWMFTSPVFVYTILKLLLIDNIAIDTLVSEHYFKCDKRAHTGALEHYITHPNGQFLLNSRYNVAFPHAKLADKPVFIRRFHRLKQILLSKNNYIYFIYISVSSRKEGNYTVDGKEPIQKLYKYIQEINILLKSFRSNFKICVFDTYMPRCQVSHLAENIICRPLRPQSHWTQLLPELKIRFYNLILSQHKCSSPTCNYKRHLNIKNNGGTHCCNACKLNKGHGPLCAKTQILPKMVIHTFGDSHSYNGWPSYIKTHHLGSKLCFSIGRDGIDITGVNNGDTIIFCFGEIDCRCHIHKHISAEKPYTQIIDTIVNSYFEKIAQAIKSYANLTTVIYNVVPVLEQYKNEEPTNYRYCGTDEERKTYTLYFNTRLREKCAEYKYVFFDIYNSYTDANGFLNKALSDNSVHIRDGTYISKFIEQHLLNNPEYK